jgi:intron-binding protein aquarius
MAAHLFRFTRPQIEAIRSGMNHGLTVIMGPPGTGKTEVALQLICNLYHNFPTQRIVVVARSNRALNNLFEKILMVGLVLHFLSSFSLSSFSIPQSDVNPRHILRLGTGEKDLFQGEQVTNEQYSKVGRVNWSLFRRQELLTQVQSLSSSLGIVGDVGSSCETASYFEQEHIRTRIAKFQADLVQMKKTESPDSLGGLVGALFPFSQYFSATESSIFTGAVPLLSLILTHPWSHRGPPKG